MKQNSFKHAPPSLAVHNLIDKLSALIGQTDLLIERTSDNPAATKHAQAIRDIAKSVVEELVQFQSDLAKIAS